MDTICNDNDNNMLYLILIWHIIIHFLFTLKVFIFYLNEKKSRDVF